MNFKFSVVLTLAALLLSCTNPLGSSVGSVSATYSTTRQSSSCSALLAAGNTTSGYYFIDPLANGNILNVYCDMVTNGGGWTLIARSVSGFSGQAFGWYSSTGTVTDDTQPYAMNVGNSGLTFTTMMFGNYTAGKTWGAFIYSQPFSQTDVANFTTINKSVGAPTVVAGGDTTSGMFALVGFTNQNTFYYFRDCCGFSTRGFFSDGWSISYNTAYGGWINGTQGLIMVR